MSTTAPPLNLPTQLNPVRGRTERAVSYGRRHAWQTGLLLWAGAAAVLGIHSSGIALPDPARFAMLDAWLIGLGCLGCPILPMRSLGRWFSPQTCMMVAVFCFALALLLTALTLGGALHFKPLIATFALILPEAAGIQSINAADAECHAVRRERLAYRRGRVEALAEAIGQRQAVLAGYGQFGAMAVGDLCAVTEPADGAIDNGAPGATILQLSAAANGHRRHPRNHPA